MTPATRNQRYAAHYCVRKRYHYPQRVGCRDTRHPEDLTALESIRVSRMMRTATRIEHRFIKDHTRHHDCELADCKSWPSLTGFGNQKCTISILYGGNAPWPISTSIVYQTKLWFCVVDCVCPDWCLLGCGRRRESTPKIGLDQGFLEYSCLVLASPFCAGSTLERPVPPSETHYCRQQWRS